MKSLPFSLVLITFLIPVQILIVVPGILIWQYGFEIPASTYWGFWTAKVVIPFGFALAGYCVTLFFIEGEGTPAPWLPPVNLMVTGPYRYVRNPMNIGVLLILLGLSLLVTSPAMGIWVAFLFVIYTLIFSLIEESSLEKRFGDNYLLYKANVGRWIPRLSGWDAPWLPVEDENPEPAAEDDDDDGQDKTKDDHEKPQPEHK